MSIQNLEAVKELLKPYLGQYLTMQGVKYRPGHLFPCINPNHDDWDGDGGSCGIVPGNQNVFRCFGCLEAGDIFLAAHMLENKPLTGKSFVVENLKYLADTFGVEMPDFKLSEEDLYEIQVKSAYAHASGILTSSELSDAVEARLSEYEWSKETRLKLGIGSVKTFTDYMDRMVKVYGYDVKFLNDIDLANSKIFDPGNLIFTVCTDGGSPIGFAARKLSFETDLELWKARDVAIRTDTSLTDEQRQNQLDENNLTKVSKYTNTSSKNRFYQKIRRLFGFHVAKKHAPPLYIMEGYPDGATAVDRGLKNTCAIGATAFTKEHVDVILECGIKHIIIVLDGDKAGYDATDRAVKVIEESVGDRIGLKVELIQMPEGSDDPDKYLRHYGLDDFEKLPRLDIFSWKVKREMQAGADPIHLANEAVPLIVNEPNFLLRLSQIRKLAQVTGVDEEYLRNEVARRVDADQSKIDEERALIVARMQSDLKRKPDSVIETMRQAMTQIESIEKSKTGYNPQNVQSAYSWVFERQESHVTDVELVTGWPIFDRKMGGMPKGAAFISSPGKPNEGKSSSCSNLAWRIPEYNDDVVTIYHTVDDSLEKAIPRILGSKYKLPSKLFKKAGYYLKGEGREEVAKNYPSFPSIYRESQVWLQQMIGDERLIIADINLLGGSLPALEDWLKTIRKRFANQSIFCMGDNFALYQLEIASDSEAVRARQKSQFVKRIATTYQASIFMTAELTKESLKPGIRPRMGNIKDTQGVAYDCDANLGIYNDLKGRGDAADLVWHDPNEMVMTDRDGFIAMQPRRKPILEMVIDKNKITDFDGAIWFEFDMVSAELRECSEAEQASCRARAEVVTTQMLKAHMGGAPQKPF